VGGSADWPFLLNMLGQGIGAGGMILNGIIISWVFGREFSDGTLKTCWRCRCGAPPCWRQFILFGLWSLALMVVVYLSGLAVGLSSTCRWAARLLWRGSLTAVIAAFLALLLSSRWPSLPAWGGATCCPSGS